MAEEKKGKLVEAAEKTEGAAEKGVKKGWGAVKEVGREVKKDIRGDKK